MINILLSLILLIMLFVMGLKLWITYKEMKIKTVHKPRKIIYYNFKYDPIHLREPKRNQNY